MKYETCKIYTAGKDVYPLWWIILDNTAFILNWSIGFILLLPFKIVGISIVSLIYLVILITIQILLKKHNCSNCYYYNKWCHLGWGKIAYRLFKPDSGNPKLGIRLSISYILQLPIIVILTLIAGFIYGFTWLNVSMLIIFIIINIMQGIVRKKSCIICKMRAVCPGSAAKITS